MSKPQKYPDELLMEAVIKYTDQCKDTISYAGLAEFARKNVEGLSEVSDYDFRRKDPVRPCRIRFEEIKRQRKLFPNVKNCVLLSSLPIERFYGLSHVQQEKDIILMREQVSELRKRNAYLEQRNRDLAQINKTDMQEIKDGIESLKRKQNELIKIEKKANHLINVFDEIKRKGLLSEIGIRDNKIDLNKFFDTLKSVNQEVYDIDKAIRVYENAMEYIDSDKANDNHESVQEESQTTFSLRDLMLRAKKDKNNGEE